MVSRSSYNLPQTPMSPKLSSGALLEKYGAGVGSGIPTHSTPSSLLGTKMMRTNDVHAHLGFLPCYQLNSLTIASFVDVI